MPKRCPNGSRRKPPKTGKCVKPTLIKNTSKKTFKKCPKNKILNPKTNRCIIDNKQNRKKVEKKSSNKSSSVNKLIVKECSKYNNLKPVDLNKIKYTGMASNKFKLHFNSTPLTEVKYISEGSYGTVYVYGKGDIKIGVKVYKNVDDEEIEIINYLNRNKISCNTINSKLIRIPGEYITIMDIMEGSLDKLKGKLTLPEIYKIIKEIAKNLNCLKKKKLSYTDLKSSNILFKCVDKKYSKITLGDLGGICKVGSDNISTWSPFEYRYDKGHVICNEKTEVWGLGVIVLELLNVSVNKFHWSNIDLETVGTINSYVNSACKTHKLNNFKLKKQTGEELLKKMLETTPKKRITLSTIINSI